MKYTKGTRLRSLDPTDVIYKRLLDMMNDYDISLKTALEWDMLGYMPYPKKGVMPSYEEEIDFYFEVNYLPQGSRVFFSGILLDYFPDYELTDEEEKTEQKDAGSPSST